MLPVPRTDKKTVYIIDRVDNLAGLARLIKRRKESQEKSEAPSGNNHSLKARKHNKSSSRKKKIM